VLARAQIAARQQQMNTDVELRFALSLVTSSLARALRLEGYGLAVGNAANFVLVEAASATHAVAEAPLRRMTFKRDRKVAEFDGAATP
jgi:cytosine deaminase